MNSTNGTDWPADIGLFGLWCLTGLAGGAVLAGAFTIGILFVPVAWLFLGISIWRTARRPGRAHTVAGLLVGPAVAIGYLDTWLTFTSDSAGDQCSTTAGVTTCEGSATCDASGLCVDTTPHTAGDGGGLVWLHVLPFIVVGAALLAVAIAILIIGHRRGTAPAPTW